jgi:hypothetical protein
MDSKLFAPTGVGTKATKQPTKDSLVVGVSDGTVYKPLDRPAATPDAIEDVVCINAGGASASVWSWKQFVEQK